MAIFNSLFSPKKIKDYFVGLLLKEENGVMMIFEKDKERITLKESEKFNYVNNFDNLTETVDEILFKLENKFQIQTTEIIFFLYSHFLEEKTGEVKKNFLIKIKNLAKRLNLKPLGYVEMAEVLSTYFSQEEKIPFTALLLEFDRSFLSLFVYKGGKIFLKKTISLSSDVVGDILSILKNKGEDFLIPTRLIVYNSKEIEDYFLQILHYQWPENIFIQTPKVEILKEEDLFKSVTYILNQQLIEGELDTEELYGKDERLGFVIGKDVSEMEKEEKQEEFQAEFTEKGENFFGKMGVYIRDKIEKLWQMFKEVKQFFSNKALSKLGFMFASGLILILLFINEYFFHKAKVIVYSPTKEVGKVVGLDLDYSISTFSSTLKQEKETSGLKTIGEKAVGEVVVYNTNLNKEKIIKKGTEVKSDGLKFVFNEEITIASAESATSPGKTTTKLIAAEIGEEYNIPKGKRFEIDDNSYAESIADFKGGSKKQVKFISKSDINELEDRILKTAQKIKNPKIDNKKISLSNLRKIEIVKKEINGELGEKATAVAYKATLSITDFYVYKDQLLTKLSEKLKRELSDDYQVDKAGIRYQIKDYQLSQKKINLKIDAKANFIKSFNTENLLKELKGKPKGSLDKIFKEKYKTVGYELMIKSFLPLVDNFLPTVKKNIKIEYSPY